MTKYLKFPGRGHTWNFMLTRRSRDNKISIVTINDTIFKIVSQFFSFRNYVLMVESCPLNVPKIRFETWKRKIQSALVDSWILSIHIKIWKFDIFSLTSKKIWSKYHYLLTDHSITQIARPRKINVSHE